MCDFDFLCCVGKTYETDEDAEAVEDRQGQLLSYVGKAGYDVLRTKHQKHHHQLWNVTTGKVVGELQYTPMNPWNATADLPEHHDDWFPEKLAELVTRTKVWCDIMSLAPPDGLFMDRFRDALLVLAKRSIEQDAPITVRMMFANIVGMPVNCTVVIRNLTKDLPKNHLLLLWVGAWRKHTSWNHAKIIAVDGRYLWTGGHNFWDPHYLKHHPVHDLSLEMEGRVAHDGHMYANAQWAYVRRKQLTLVGSCVNLLPDSLPMVLPARVTVSEYPEGTASIFPPMYLKSHVPKYDVLPDALPIMSIGRYGTLIRNARPSDDAIVAMLGAAKKVVHLALQDLGPVTIPGTKITLPGCVWPKEYLNVLGRILWTRGVDVEIVLSNPNSIPGGLSPTEANYGNGWSCVDVAAEIIKAILVQFPEANDQKDKVRTLVAQNLRVCFIRVALGCTWEDGTNMGMHAKHFIIDDMTTYIGSQNLYICDLAEWGVVIDDKAATQKMMKEYWQPLWRASYLGTDVDVQAVMDGLLVDRSAPKESDLPAEAKAKLEEGENHRFSVAVPHNTEMFEMNRYESKRFKSQRFKS